MTTQNKQPAPYTRESLRLEQLRLKSIIRTQETELRHRVQKVPGELLYAGVDLMLPSFMSGKFSDRILNAGRNFINKSVLKKASGNTSRLVTAAKQAGLFALLKMAYTAFIRRK